MAKLGIYAIVLALLVGLVVASGLSGHDTNNLSDDAIAGVAFRYVECAAYYQVTADVLQTRSLPASIENEPVLPSMPGLYDLADPSWKWRRTGTGLRTG